MARFLAGVALAALMFGTLTADDKPDRPATVQAIRAESRKALDGFHADAVARKLKPDEEGFVPGWDDFRKPFVARARTILDADATDEAGLDAIVLLVTELGAKSDKAELLKLAFTHHLQRGELAMLLKPAPDDLLKRATESTNVRVRSWAKLHTAERAYAAGNGSYAEIILVALSRDKAAEEFGVPHQAKRLLFEVRNLNVGLVVPEVAGPDTDGKPLKLSEYRGKATLLSFWATWCGPCMDAIPHERELVKRYEGKPFAIVGVNGDRLQEKDAPKLFVNGEPYNDDDKVRAAVEKHKITWRSFRNGRGVATEWNVDAWPTFYLIDHKGVIVNKFRGTPDTPEEIKAFDAAVEAAVKAAEVAAKP